MDIADLTINIVMVVGLLTTAITVAIKFGKHDRKNEDDIIAIKKQQESFVSKESHYQTVYRIGILEKNMAEIAMRTNDNNDDIVAIKENLKNIETSQTKTDKKVDKIFDIISDMQKQLAIVVDFVSRNK